MASAPDPQYCPECKQYLKSQSGFTRHVNSKHPMLFVGRLTPNGLGLELFPANTDSRNNVNLQPAQGSSTITLTTATNDTASPADLAEPPQATPYLNVVSPFAVTTASFN